MPLYTLVVVDPAGAISNRYQFRAGNDAVAEQTAAHLQTQRETQLWDGARRVRTWASGAEAGDGLACVGRR